ncbi:MAG: hypothetical protein HDR71_18180 [Lachnospiraceae bacterium]|nr:hypothetical protein [Lachnospiraceae bacterium]
MKYSVITAGAENEYMKQLTAVLKEDGHQVSAQRDKADMLIFAIDPSECDGNDYEKFLENYEIYSMGLVRTVNEVLPFLKESSIKRLCFLTTLSSGINNVSSKDHWERIIGASCNMAIRTFFNHYSREGYTFRVFGVNDFSEDSASRAAEYFLQNRSLEEESDLHSDEKRLVMRDRYEREYAW